MIGRLTRLLLGRGAEILLAVAIVLGFFLGFMGLFSISFPQGTSLGDLMRSGRAADRGSAAGSPRFELDGDESIEGEPFVALLSHIHRSVKDKPSDAIAWTDARAGSQLGEYHAVQTFDRSRATITFSEDSALTLNENSLIIVKSTRHDAHRNMRRASLIVLDGELRGSIAISDRESVSVEIEAATESARIRSDAGPGTRTEFTVRVNEDRSSTFSVLDGSAEVTSASGSMIVGSNSAVTVDEGGALGPVVSLPPAPALVDPRNGNRERIRSSRARLTFRWSAGSAPPPGAPGEPGRAATGETSYVLRVARDRRFRDVVHQEIVPGFESILGNFRDGEYHWRVSARRGALEGPPSPPRTFRVVRDRREPDLTVDFPDGVVDRSNVVLTGRVEPGTRVIIADQEVVVDPSGAFSHTVPLERGVNVIVVEAIDEAGNVTYRSRAVNARY